MKQYPSAIKEKVRNQIAAGRSQKEISREYGISKYTPMWHFIPNFHSLPFFVWVCPKFCVNTEMRCK